MKFELKEINKDIQIVLQHHKTPFYLYNVSHLRKNIEAIKSILTEDIKLCYSIKANPLVVSYMQDLVTYFEVCSYGEYEICREYIGKDKKIIFGGVCKLKEEILEAIKDKRIIVTIESITQLHDINECCKLLGITKEVFLRMSTGNQFGLSMVDLEEIISQRDKYKSIKIKGVQLYANTQCFQINKEKEYIKQLFEVIDQLEKNYGYKINIIDYGGGIGVPYYKKDLEKTNWEEMLQAISQELRDKSNGRQIIYEAGRIIPASCGIYVSSVCDQKINNKRRYSILDGGINHIKYYGQAFGGRNVIAKVLNGQEEKDIYTVCGPLCTSNDILLRQMELAKHNIGDKIIFLNAGAYCQTEAAGLFLSRDLPAIFIIDENKTVKCVRNKIKTYTINSTLTNKERK
ncbi:alanine racemase [Vallitalea sp.]|jgi:diaminopimelate decarboxylase|uniref:alanine racemase n=1 Tax=Vallitalea sp. TaxID=1882829 RepID=UPI0025EFAD1D|nr:alanine racemase [Vallitalea sp.]MCT4688875.1 alanine racemase [Vallitalea sp.]